MSDLSNLALNEIIKLIDQAESDFMKLCREKKITDMATRDTTAFQVFGSLQQIQRWAEAIRGVKP